MLNWIVYSFFRMLAQLYLYFAGFGRWKVLENSWTHNDTVFERYRIHVEGHVRHFVFVKEDSYYLDENLDWHEIITFSDSILACTLNPAIGVDVDTHTTDITDIIKEFSHYISSNPFLTFHDLFKLFLSEKIEKWDCKNHYNIMIIYDDLSEKECIVKGEDSLQRVFKFK